MSLPPQSTRRRKRPERIAQTPARLHALSQLALLDTPPEERFERITCLAARLFDVPLVAIGLIDKERVWWKSSLGFEGSQIPLKYSFCAEVLRQDAPLLVQDARLDPRFAENPLVSAEPFARFYAGYPLYSSEGFCLGTFAVMDHRPRLWKETDQQTLESLSAWAVHELQAQQFHQVQRREQNSTVRMRAVLNNVNEGIITINAQGEIESFNPAAERIFGYHPSEILGKNIIALLELHSASSSSSGSPAQTPSFARASSQELPSFARASSQELPSLARASSQELSSPAPTSLEELPSLAAPSSSESPALTISQSLALGGDVTGRRRDGSIFPMEISISEMKLENKQMYTAIVRDITERKKAEERLKESEERYRELFESATDLIQMFDLQGRFLYVNPAWRETLGYRASQVKELGIWDIVHPESREVCQQAFAEAMRGNKVDKFEAIFVTREEEKIYVEGSVSCKFEEGYPVSTRGIFHDVTQRKQIEQMKNEFISTVSHELRTPVASIRGFLGLLASGAVGELPDEAMEMIQIAHKNTERLVRLINDILDIKKIESGKMEFVLTPLFLMPIIEQALRDHEGFAHQYNVQLCLTEVVPNAKVYADSNRLLQVLDNLLSNAVKYSPENEKVHVSVTEEGEFYRVTIADHGPGIPDDFRERVFDKFSQADMAYVRKKEGTGLGLSICKAIVEAMDGHIDFLSHLGQGSTFFFDLPRYHES